MWWLWVLAAILALALIVVLILGTFATIAGHIIIFSEDDDRDPYDFSNEA